MVFAHMCRHRAAAPTSHLTSPQQVSKGRISHREVHPLKAEEQTKHLLRTSAPSEAIAVNETSKN